MKSCRRVEVRQATVGRFGFAGDREWQINLAATGEFVTQRQHPVLAGVQPVLVDGGIRLRCDGLPDLEVRHPAVADREVQTSFGTVSVGDAGDEAAAWFERVVGVPCRLSAIAPGYSRWLPGSLELFGQEVSLSDAAPVLLVNEASHRFLLDRAREPFGIERFRPNLVVDGAEPWEEDTWRTLRIGGASLRVPLPWPRCSIPQVDQETGERHREPAVVLKRYRWCSEAPGLPRGVASFVAGKALFGVGCSMIPEGSVIAVGDTVEVEETGDPLIPAPVEPAAQPDPA